LPLLNRLFQAALGVNYRWFLSDVDFGSSAKRLTIQIDFVSGTRFRTRRQLTRIPWMTQCRSATDT